MIPEGDKSMLDFLTKNETIAGIAAVLSTVGIIAKKIGLLHVGRIPQPIDYSAIAKDAANKAVAEISKSCSDSICHEKVVTNSGQIEILKKGQEIIFSKIDDMPQKIVTLLKDTKGLL